MPLEWSSSNAVRSAGLRAAETIIFESARSSRLCLPIAKSGQRMPRTNQNKRSPWTPSTQPLFALQRWRLAGEKHFLRANRATNNDLTTHKITRNCWRFVIFCFLQRTPSARLFSPIFSPAAGRPETRLPPAPSALALSSRSRHPVPRSPPCTARTTAKVSAHFLDRRSRRGRRLLHR